MSCKKCRFWSERRTLVAKNDKKYLGLTQKIIVLAKLDTYVSENR